MAKAAVLIVAVLLACALCTRAQLKDNAFFTIKDSATSTILNGVDLVLTSESARAGGAQGAIYIDPNPDKDLFVYADTVTIIGNNGVLAKFGRFTGGNGGNGASVSIVARKLICGEQNCAIDTSGMSGKDWGNERAPRPNPPGGANPSENGNNGIDGQPGGNGGSAGDIQIYVDTMEGTFRFKATGGAGGRGQIGSDGVNGAPGLRGENVQCSCGVFSCSCTGEARRDSPRSGVAAFYGKDGGRGGNGGRAGATGSNGNGGAGGQVIVYQATSSTSYQVEASGGAGGYQTQRASPGTGALGGTGGCGGLIVTYAFPPQKAFYEGPSTICYGSVFTIGGPSPLSVDLGGKKGTDGAAGASGALPPAGRPGAAAYNTMPDDTCSFVENVALTGGEAAWNQQGLPAWATAHTPSSCCRLCAALQPQCGAWSWSRSEKRCYYKSTINALQESPNADMVSGYSGVSRGHLVAFLAARIDFVGGDVAGLNPVQAYSVEGCAMTCKQRSECTAFTLTTSGNCFLKRTRSSSPGWSPAAAPSRAIIASGRLWENYNFEKVDYPGDGTTPPSAVYLHGTMGLGTGPDLAFNMSITRTGACGLLCHARIDCGAFQVGADGCRLKGTSGWTTGFNRATASGIVVRGLENELLTPGPRNRQCSAQVTQDQFIDSFHKSSEWFIKEIVVYNPSDCCIECEQVANCQAWSWRFGQARCQLYKTGFKDQSKIINSGRGSAFGYKGTGPAPVNYMRNKATAAQLSIALRKVQLLYMGDATANGKRVTDMLKWIVQTGCNDDAPTCAAVQQEATLVMRRLQSGVDYYGFPSDHAPTLTLAVIQNYICNTLLDTLKTVEDKAKQFFEVAASENQKRTELEAAIQKYESSITSTRSQIAEWDRQIGEQIRTVNDLTSERLLARDAVETYRSSFQQAIMKEKYKDLELKALSQFYEFAQSTVTIGGTVASIASGGSVDPFEGIDNAVAWYNSAKGLTDTLDEMGRIGQFPSAWDSIQFVADGESPRQQFLNFKDALNDVSKRNKLAMSREQWNAAIEPYLKLEAGQAYQEAIEAFVMVCEAYSSQLQRLQGLYVQKAEAEEGITSMTSLIAGYRATASRGNFATGVINNLMDDMYRDLQIRTIRALYQLKLAAQYALLRPVELQITERDFLEYGSHAVLSGKRSAINEQIYKAMQDFTSANTLQHIPYVISITTEQVPDLVSRLNSANGYTFSIDPCWPYFNGLYNVKISEVYVLLEGVQKGAWNQQPPAARNVRLQVTHRGEVQVFDREMKKWTFTHSPRVATMAYDYQRTNQVAAPAFMEFGCNRVPIPQDCLYITIPAKFDSTSRGQQQVCGTAPPSDETLLIGVSPFAQFTVRALRADNPGIDFSRVTTLSLSFALTAYSTTTRNPECPDSLIAPAARIAATPPGLPVKVARRAALQSKSTATRALGAQSASPDQQAKLCADGKADTWCQTVGTNPWWGVALKGQTAVTGVTITLRGDAAYNLTSLHDVEVRVGAMRPTASRDPSTINTRCALHSGQLGAKPGETVSLRCEPGLMAGRFVTVQIRSAPEAVDLLSMAEVTVFG